MKVSHLFQVVRNLVLLVREVRELYHVIPDDQAQVEEHYCGEQAQKSTRTRSVNLTAPQIEGKS